MEIHETIRRLLQMTVENGTSIQEAETAAAAIRRLLDKHGLTLEQVKAKFDQPQLAGFLPQVSSPKSA